LASDSTWVPDTKIYQSWVHRLGNLVLLSRKKNSSASNREFAWKKNSYFTKGGVCGFALTTQVLQHPKWTADVIQAQQTLIMNVFETHWRLEERKSKAEVAKEVLAELSSDSDGIYFELEKCQARSRRTRAEKYPLFHRSRTVASAIGMVGTATLISAVARKSAKSWLVAAVVGRLPSGLRAGCGLCQSQRSIRYGLG
jgi:hypothetical protein